MFCLPIIQSSKGTNRERLSHIVTRSSIRRNPRSKRRYRARRTSFIASLQQDGGVSPSSIDSEGSISEHDVDLIHDLGQGKDEDSAHWDDDDDEDEEQCDDEDDVHEEEDEDDEQCDDEDDVHEEEDEDENESVDEHDEHEEVESEFDDEDDEDDEKSPQSSTHRHFNAIHSSKVARQRTRIINLVSQSQVQRYEDYLRKPQSQSSQMLSGNSLSYYPQDSPSDNESDVMLIQSPPRRVRAQSQSMSSFDASRSKKTARPWKGFANLASVSPTGRESEPARMTNILRNPPATDNVLPGLRLSQYPDESTQYSELDVHISQSSRKSSQSKKRVQPVQRQKVRRKRNLSPPKRVRLAQKAQTSSEFRTAAQLVAQMQEDGEHNQHKLDLMIEEMEKNDPIVAEKARRIIRKRRKDIAIASKRFDRYEYEYLTKILQQMQEYRDKALTEMQEDWDRNNSDKHQLLIDKLNNKVNRDMTLQQWRDTAVLR